MEPRRTTGLVCRKTFGLAYRPEGNATGEGAELSRLRLALGRRLPLGQAVGLAVGEMDGQLAGALQTLDLVHGLAHALHLETHGLVGLRACARHAGQTAK